MKARLLTQPQAMPEARDLVPDWQPDTPFARPPVPAAVLIALIRRETDYSVLYTARSGALRNHSGQVAFPGGRIDPEDVDAGAAALREAYEEVALIPEDAQVLGYMPYLYTGTNYFITPVVAVVEPRGPFVANPAEVEAIFEVPLERVLESRNYGTLEVRRGNRTHATSYLDHAGHRIWGITAKLTQRFSDCLRAAEVEA